MYGWTVKTSTQGVDATYKGGYHLDTNVGPGGQPSVEGSRIYSQGKAISQCLAYINRMQSAGQDAEGTVEFKIFGQDAVNPVKALSTFPGTIDDEKVCARLDRPERAYRRAISLANRVADDIGEFEADDFKEDVGIAQ